MSAITSTPVTTTPSGARTDRAPISSRYGPWDVCSPPAPPAEETPAEQRARLRREMDDVRDCVNSELIVRNESSLLSLILFKVVLPFSAIAAGMTAVYIAVLRFAEARSTHAELLLGFFYLLFASAMLWLARGLRQTDESRRRALHRTVTSTLNLSVPPRKEKLARNQRVNRWIFNWLTWGTLIALPLIFAMFRANATDRIGFKLIFDTAGVCDATPGGFNPYEGSKTCPMAGAGYRTATFGTGGDPAIGDPSEAAGATFSHARPDPNAVDAAEVRLDVTTSLGLFFFILIAGIGITMIRWRLEQRRTTRAPPPAGATAAAPAQGGD